MKIIISKENRIIRLLRIIALIGALYCAVRSQQIGNLYNIWLLPTVYLCCVLICYHNAESIKGNPGSLILNCIMPFRYVILPMIIYSSGELSRYNKGYQYVGSAVYLMIYELIVMFLVLELSAIKYEKKEYINHDFYDSSNTFYSMSGGVLIAVIVLGILSGIAIFYKDLSSGIRMIFSGVAVQTASVASSNIANIIWQVLCVWLFMYLIMNQKRKQMLGYKANVVASVILITLVFGFVTFIESVEFNRWYTIVSVLAALATIIHIFPNDKKKYLICILIPIASLMLLITAYKNGGFSVGGSFGESIQGLMDSSLADVYFSGPVSVNNAIALKESSSLGFKSLLPDLLNNMPIIGNLISPENTTVYSYNMFLGRIYGTSRGDLIIPLVGQSSIYFGYFFAPLLTAIAVQLMRWADYKFRNTYSYTVYAYAFAAVGFAVMPIMLNLTINANWLYIRTLPFGIILFFTNIISERRNALEGDKL